MTDKKMGIELQNQIRKFKNRPFLFVGTGISKRYIGAPTWEELLKEFVKLVDSDPLAFNKYSNNAKNKLDNLSLVHSKDYLFPMIAQLIEKEYNTLFFNNTDFEDKLKSTFKSILFEINNPFKFALANRLKELKFTSVYETEKNALMRIKNKVSAVITTNYDTFLERFFDYTVFVGEKDLLNKPIDYIGEVYKINGCVNDPNSIVITHEDYESLRERSKYLAAKILTIFIESPIIFIGYSISDEYILSVLRDISICLSDEQKERLSNNIMFIERCSNENEQNVVSIDKEGIMMTKYTLRDFGILYHHISKFVESKIPIKTLRKLQHLIKPLILNSESDELVRIDDIENEDLVDEKLAVHIGNEKSVFTSGYKAISRKDIIRNVIYNSSNYDAELLLLYTIPTNWARYNRSKLPLYYYIRKFKNYDSKLDQLLINNISDIYGKSEHPDTYRFRKKSLNEIRELNLSTDRELTSVYMSINNLTIDDIEEYLQSTFSIYETGEFKNDTQYSKIVAVYDLLKYK